MFKLLYVLAALYDGLLGLAFLLDGPRIYAHLQILPPNHWGYVHFGAGILIIFGIMFAEIASKPAASGNLIKYGILLKICYVATIAWYQTHGGLAPLWLWFAAFDLVFLLLFLASLRAYRRAP